MNLKDDALRALFYLERAQDDIRAICEVGDFGATYESQLSEVSASLEVLKDFAKSRLKLLPPVPSDSTGGT